jgi:hypothetical protein
VTAFRANAPEPIYTAHQSHPNFVKILDGLRRGDPSVWDLFDVAGGIMRRFQQVSERYSWNGSDVLFDGDPVDGPFADLLSRSLEEGNVENYTALAKFGEKVAQNPSEWSREQSFRFLSNHRFQITADGDVVAYKSVYDTGRVDAQGRKVYESGYASKVKGKPSAFVNGVAVPELSKVPQSIGDVVTMPRSEVDEDPNRSCSRGLHVATVNYWGGFKPGVIEVHVNPRDFVAIPNAEDAKARVHRYYVSRVAVEPDSSTVLTDAPTYQWAGDVGYRV